MNNQSKQIANNGKADINTKKNNRKISHRKINISIPQNNSIKKSELKINNNSHDLIITADVPKNSKQKGKNINFQPQKIQYINFINNKNIIDKNFDITQKLISIKKSDTVSIIPQVDHELCNTDRISEKINENIEENSIQQNSSNSNSNLNIFKRSNSCGQRNKFNNGDIFIKKKAQDEFKQYFTTNNNNENLDVKENIIDNNTDNIFDTDKYITYLNDNIFNNNLNIYKKINPKAHINFFNLNMNFNVNYTDNVDLTLKPYKRNLSVEQRRINKIDEISNNNNENTTTTTINNNDNVNTFKIKNEIDNNTKTLEIKNFNPFITDTNFYNSSRLKSLTSRIKEDEDIFDLLNNENSQINLEDFLFVIHKIDSIKNNLNIFINNSEIFSPKQLLECINRIRIKTYDLYTFYMSCSFEGIPQNYLLLNNNIKETNNFMNYYSVIFILCLGIFYTITHKIKMTKDYQKKLLKLLNLQEKTFLILCDAVMQKIKNNILDEDNFAFNQLVNEINRKNILSSLITNNNHLLQIKKLCIESYNIINDILFNFYTLTDQSRYNNQEVFMYKYFYNKDINYLSKMKISEIEELFNKNVFKVINLRSNYANITSLKGVNKNKEYISNNDNIINEYKSSKIKIPYLDFPSKKELTLVLDLDETMISFNFIEAEEGLGKMRLRPGLEDFLEAIRDYYEIIVFTSGTKDYADTILDIIEMKKNTKYFSGRLYREHTTMIGKKYIKDLSKLGRDLSRTLIVDNFPYCFKLQRENGILIKSFFADNTNDKVLFELQRILINIYYDKTDVRKSILKYREDILKNVTCIDDIN